jgi:hypothetical protein
VAERLFDILLALKGEDSYGAGFWSGLFGGFLPQPPYFGGGQRRGFTFGLPAHRSLFGDEPVYDRSEEKAKREPSACVSGQSKQIETTETDSRS